MNQIRQDRFDQTHGKKLFQKPKSGKTNNRKSSTVEPENKQPSKTVSFLRTGNLVRQEHKTDQKSKLQQVPNERTLEKSMRRSNR